MRHARAATLGVKRPQAPHLPTPPAMRQPARSWRLAPLLLLCSALAGPVPVNAQDDSAQPVSSLIDRARALDRARLAVLGVQVKAVADARSAATLGSAREGSGVVIGDDGLVLTIGYLVLEADDVTLRLAGARQVPARVLAHDAATGLGLLQALAPLGVAPAPLAQRSPTLGAGPLTMVSGGAEGAVSVARLRAQGPFTGYWEYHLEQALVTDPGRQDHNGAALFNGLGELVGIGALYLSDADAALDTPPMPQPALRTTGNLFVPTGAVPGLLDELRRSGRSQASVRAWLGLNCVAVDGELRVLRVTPDSPADLADLRPGDRILQLDGQQVSSLAGLWQALWQGGPPERAVSLQIQRGAQAQTLTAYTVDRIKTLRRPEGI